MSGRSARRAEPQEHLPGGADRHANGNRSRLEASLEDNADGILIVHESGRMVPLSPRVAREWGFPQRVVRRLALETGLRRALGREEFELYYQPQAEVGSGRVSGAEALLRWQHPDWGLVSAEGFIALAEDTRLIAPLGEWVLRTACAQARAWQDCGVFPLRVAVNLSVRQFQQPDLVLTLAAILAETGFPAGNLELEITEGVAMDDPARASPILESIRDMGIHISLDDFGTGYSSLSYLKHLPVDALKIDLSFVRELTTDYRDSAIIRAIIDMGHSLGLEVIAEGVETEEQLAFLRGHGCDKFQGYLLAAPAPPSDMGHMLPREAGAPTVLPAVGGGQ